MKSLFKIYIFGVVIAFVMILVIIRKHGFVERLRGSMGKDPLCRELVFVLAIAGVILLFSAMSWLFVLPAGMKLADDMLHGE